MPINKKFRERVNCLLRLVKENRYPNYTMMIKEMKKLDVAGAYNISRKTIQRDVAYLKEELHAPIEYDPVNRGYYLTNPYWEGYIPFLEEHEIDAAIIGAHLAETILPPSRLQEDIRKGTDALWSRNNGSADDFMVLSALVSNGSCAKVDPEIFQTVFEAWREQFSLHIKYMPVNGNSVSEMKLEPHVLTLFDNVWYIRAKIRQVGEVRVASPEFKTFALHRIKGVMKLTGHFELDRHEVEKVNRGELYDLEKVSHAKLKLTGQAAKYGQEYLPVASIKKGDDDSIILALKEVEEFRILNFIMTSMGEAIVLSPPELQQKILDAAEKIKKNQAVANNET
jgi:proteasome accessory factor B